LEVKGINTTLIPALHGLGDVNLLEPCQAKGPDGEPMDLEIIMRCALLPTHEAPVEPKQYAELDNITRGIKVRKGDLCGA
jgi:hypothetical protein